MFETLIKKKASVDDGEYLQYAQEVEWCLSQLETELHDTDDPEDSTVPAIELAGLEYCCFADASEMHQVSSYA